MLSLLAFFANTIGTPKRSAQIVARAMPLASAVRIRVMSLPAKHFANSCGDLLHRGHVDPVIQETVDLDDVTGQDFAFLPDPFLQKLHGNLPPFSIVDAYIMPEKRGKSNRKNRLREKNRNGPAACLHDVQSIGQDE